MKIAYYDYTIIVLLLSNVVNKLNSQGILDNLGLGQNFLSGLTRQMNMPEHGDGRNLNFMRENQVYIFYLCII